MKGPKMFIHIVLLAAMAVLYGLAWHNQPAKDAQDRTEQSKKI
jgi:hypothetical protein